MAFQTKEFASLDEFLQWYDTVAEHIMIVKSYRGTMIVVVYLEVDTRVYDLWNSESV